MTNRELRMRCIEIAIQHITNQINFDDCKITVPIENIFEYAKKIEAFVNQVEPDLSEVK